MRLLLHLYIFIYINTRTDVSSILTIVQSLKDNNQNSRPMSNENNDYFINNPTNNYQNKQSNRNNNSDKNI